MVYPDKINALVDIAGTSTLAVVGHAARHNDLNDALDELKVVLTVPAANTLALAPGGTERLRIDSSGNVYGVAAQNLLYNGAMQVAQRATSVAGITVSNASYRTVDRYLIACTGTQEITASVENDAPTGSGFRKSSKILVTTAQATPSAGDEMAFFQRLEGQDLQCIKKGTASAEQLTLSFWVKSNVTGTFIAELYDYDNGRNCSKAYTISASGTWEYKTITFPPDITGALDNDNGLSLHALFFLTAGSNLTSGTLATTWASATTANRAAGQSNLGAATSNYWQVTGVQLEVGPIASPFQFKAFGQQLLECQRYYERTIPYGETVSTGSGGQIGVGGPDSVASTYLYCNWLFKVEKRGNPTVTIYDYLGNSGKITTWQSGSTTNNVTPGNANWVNSPTSHTVLHSGAVAGWQYKAIASAEL